MHNNSDYFFILFFFSVHSQGTQLHLPLPLCLLKTGRRLDADVGDTVSLMLPEGEV